MRFVDDIDLRSGLGARGIHRALAEIAGVVHAAVGCGIELDDIQIRGTGPDAPAGVALAAGLAA